MHAHSDAASPWIARFAHLVPAGARVLDLAAGSGRHSRFFAERGAHVVAVDRDATALAAVAQVEGVQIRVLDLESDAWPLAGERFDAVVVVNYLHRPLFPHLRAALGDSGVLLYETFARGNAAYGRPSNPDFLLEPDELLQLAFRPPAMTVAAFEQGVIVRGGERAVLQRIAASAPGATWPPVTAAA